MKRHPLSNGYYQVKEIVVWRHEAEGRGVMQKEKQQPQSAFGGESEKQEFLLEEGRLSAKYQRRVKNQPGNG